MKGPLYISDDGKCEGTQEEVEAYEASLNPIAKFAFPWSMTPNGWRDCNDNSVKEFIAGIALLNLMPLVEELRQGIIRNYGKHWRRSDFTTGIGWTKATIDLLLAYEKALGVKA